MKPRPLSWVRVWEDRPHVDSVRLNVISCYLYTIVTVERSTDLTLALHEKWEWEVSKY